MNAQQQNLNKDDFFNENDYKNIKDVLENKPESVGILRNSFASDAERQAAKQKYKEAFSYFDKDHSGFINSGELTYMLQSFGNEPMSSQDIRLLFGRELYKNNGYINYEQLLNNLFGD